MLKKKTLKQNIQEIINEKTQIENHHKLKNSLRKSGVNVVDLPETAIKKHINELMDAAEVKNQILSQKPDKAMYINASTLKHYVSKLVKHFVKLELENQQ